MNVTILEEFEFPINDNTESVNELNEHGCMYTPLTDDHCNSEESQIQRHLH